MPFALEGVFNENEPIKASIYYNLILEKLYSNEGNEKTFQEISALLDE